MKIKSLILTLAAALLSISPQAVSSRERYAGGDISLLPEYEKAGAKYLDHDGKPVGELLPWLRKEGMNAMRIRIFVDPSAYNGSDRDPNACQNLDYILPLCRRIKEAGFSLMLDFHYSDTWADPAKQWTPAAWRGLDDETLAGTLDDYTARVLSALKRENAVPDFIQVGNEISYGMLWGGHGDPESSLHKTFMGSEANWGRLASLLKAGIGACRRECPQAGIVLHTERVATPDVLLNFYREMQQRDVDYDIIGLSYYPYFHGTLQRLSTAISDLEKSYPEKDIMIVETGYPYKWEVPGTTERVDYPYSDTGQDAFTRDLVDMLLKHESVTGLFWWWMEYNAYSTSLSGWYNAPLFDSLTGRATSALRTLCRFASTGAAAPEIGFDDDGSLPYVDMHGIAHRHPSAPGLYIQGKRKIVIR